MTLCSQILKSTRKFSKLKKEDQSEVGRQLRKILRTVADCGPRPRYARPARGPFVSLMDNCLEDGDLRKLCASRGIVTDQQLISLKEEDIKKEPKTEPKEEPKIEPKEEPEEEPTDTDVDVDEMMAEAEADIPRWRSEMEACNAAENNNGKDETEYVS